MKPSQRIEEIRQEMIAKKLIEFPDNKELNNPSPSTFILSALIEYMDQEYEKHA